jgi:hypothetical protein
MCNGCVTPAQSASTGSPMSNPTDSTVIIEDLSGTLIGGWRLVALLGRGGMATVYRGEAGDVAAIVNEAMVMRAVRDARVVTATSCGEDVGLLYLAMELLPGGDTKALTADRGRLDDSEVLRLAEQCARGLRAIHAAGYLHRDLKPSNVMLDGCGDAKIVDLGLVFPLRRESSGSTILGTPAYMSPEQARGEALDATTDLWSLGATMWHWAVGRPPFVADDALMVMDRVANGPVEDPRPLAPIGEHLGQLILRLMERRRDHRFADADEVLAAIRAVRGGLPPPEPRRCAAAEAAPVEPPRTMPRRLAFLAGAGVAAALLVGSAFVFGGAPAAAPAAPAAVGDGEAPAWAGAHVVRWIDDDRLPLRELGPMRYERSGARALFAGSALVGADAPPPALAMKRAEEFTVELVLTPGDLVQQGPARIVALSLNHRLGNLMIGQSGSRLEARCRTTTTNPDGTRPSLATPEGALTGRTQHIAFVRRAGRNELWVDGACVANADVPGTLAAWDPDFPLVVGDEHRGGYPWSGSLDRLALYARPLDPAEIVARAACLVAAP